MSTTRKDGRLQGSIVLENPLTGKRKRFYYYGWTQRELQTAREALLKEFNRHYISGAVGFREFCEDYLTAKEKDDGLEPTSLENYRRQLKNHILPNLRSDIELAEITPAMVKHILETINGTGTKKFVYTLLSSLFREAKFRGLVELNPCEYVHPPKHSAKIATVITPEIYRQLMDAVSGTVYEYLFKFAWATGLRRGEICALRWTDIDFKAGTVNVSRSIKIADGVEYEGKPKTEYSNRTIALDNNTIQELKNWRRELVQRLTERGLAFELNGYVWRSPHNISERINLKTITDKFNKLKNILKLGSGIRFHSFRHTHASLLAAADLSPKKIQARLGHASAAFTLDRYIHKTAAINDGVVDIIDKVSQEYQPTKTLYK